MALFNPQNIHVKQANIDGTQEEGTGHERGEWDAGLLEDLKYKLAAVT